MDKFSLHLKPLVLVTIAVALALGMAGSVICADLPERPQSVQAGSDSVVTPIQPHPENPRYFLFRGKPTVLISPAEHYGAVINLDFDYVPYLEALAADGFNLTRLFVGAYVEQETSIPFVKGYDNTLAPRPGRFLAPWARSDEPGYFLGGNKFDLDRWDESFFARLADFVEQAGARGIVVEVVMLSQMYNDKLWACSPLHHTNNINGLPAIGWADFNTLECEPLVVRQEALCRKVVDELAEYDNVYFEICNEPNFQTVTVKKSAEWASRILNAIWEADADAPHRHMIAFQDASVLIDRRISVYNFHYATGSNWVGALQGIKKYYNLNKILAFDETSDVAAGQPLSRTRTDGWQFMLGGGAVYNHLSWVYTPDDEAGNSELGRETRKQFRVLKEFMESLDFLRMAPANNVVTGGIPKRAICRAFAKAGECYAIHITGGTQANLEVAVPAGTYLAEWIDPKTGAVTKSDKVQATGETTVFSSNEYVEDIALRIVRVKE